MLVSFFLFGGPTGHIQTHSLPRTSRAGTCDIRPQQLLREGISSTEDGRSDKACAFRRRGMKPPPTPKRVYRNEYSTPGVDPSSLDCSVNVPRSGKQITRNKTNPGRTQSQGGEKNKIKKYPGAFSTCLGFTGGSLGGGAFSWKETFSRDCYGRSMTPLNAARVNRTIVPRRLQSIIVPRTDTSIDGNPYEGGQIHQLFAF